MHNFNLLFGENGQQFPAPLAVEQSRWQVCTVTFTEEAPEGRPEPLGGLKPPPFMMWKQSLASSCLTAQTDMGNKT